MRDEHLIYADLPDGKVKILPEQGYKLYCKLTKAYLAEAIVKPQEIKWFVSEVLAPATDNNAWEPGVYGWTEEA